MTYGEIYDNIAFKIWGSSAVPAGAATMLMGPTNSTPPYYSSGIIANAARRIQQIHNFWWMHGYTSYATTFDTGLNPVQAYTLPADFKELITAQFAVQDEDYFMEPMTPLGLGDAQRSKWITGMEPVEYPTSYELIGESIVIYPPPLYEDYYFHMTYWAFVGRPPVNTLVAFRAATDDVALYAYDAIINWSVAEMKENLEEYQAAAVYKQKFWEEIELLKEEDRRRRQHIIAEVQSSEGF